MALMLEATAEAAIRVHARAAYPHECCGALIGGEGRVQVALPLPNTTPDGPRRRFLVGPEDYREAEVRAEAAGGVLLGFYHSHPDHPAEPSQHDLDHAWPSFSYVIVSVVAGRDRDLRSWRLAADRSRFVEEPVVAAAGSDPAEAAAGAPPAVPRPTGAGPRLPS